MNIDILQTVMSEENFRGCVHVVKNGETIFSAACGYADLPNHIPNTMATRFATASAGKVFVAVGILQLIERGHLRFTDTLGTILPRDWKSIDTNITIEQLLTHTSGIPDYFDESTMVEYGDLWRDFPNYRIRKNEDLLPLFIDKPMMYERGSRFQYNNTGFVVLAMIMEEIAGLPFDTYLDENIFKPAGMEETGYFELDSLPERCADHYIFDTDKNRYRTNIFSVDAKGTGAGGAFTTVGDVEKFWEALLSSSLISASLTEEMLKEKSGSEEEGYYGDGIWLTHETGKSPSIFFQGADPGVSFITVYDPNEDKKITLVSNYGDSVWGILKRIRETDAVTA